MALACPGEGKRRKRPRSQAQMAKVPDLGPAQGQACAVCLVTVTKVAP
jgi:hypothetical protein